MSSIVQQLTFMAGNLARTPFREQVQAAAAAGFDSISIWPNIWRHALNKQGLTLADMRAMLDDHGLKLTDGDAYRDWVPAPATDSGRFGPIRSGTSRQEFFDVCRQLGGTSIVAVHLTDTPLHMDRDTEGFARLCDDAAEHGLRIALEFVAFSNVPDVATAWKIVEGAGRSNGGLVVDSWHHMRSSNDNEALRRVPADRVYTVQFSDGPKQSPHGLVEEAMYHRALPGDGDLDVPGFLRTLSEMGVRAAVGPELYQASFEQRAPVDVMRELVAATDRVFTAAGLEPPSARR